MLIKFNTDVFMLFYAIAWGIVANVQGRWKAFHWPVIHEIDQAKRRAILSFVFFNVLPFSFFAYVLFVLSTQNQALEVSHLSSAFLLVVQAMLPSLGVFGFYRIWLGIVEKYPGYFYETDLKKLPKNYRHLEPIAHTKAIKNSENLPIVYIGSHTVTAGPNIKWGIIYLIISGIAPWVHC